MIEKQNFYSVYLCSFLYLLATHYERCLLQNWWPKYRRNHGARCWVSIDL